MASIMFSRQPVQITPVRYLDLHEYQSKALMASNNVRVQRGKMAETPDQAFDVAEELVASGMCV